MSKKGRSGLIPPLRPYWGRTEASVIQGSIPKGADTPLAPPPHLSIDHRQQ